MSSEFGTKRWVPSLQRERSPSCLAGRFWGPAGWSSGLEILGWTSCCKVHSPKAQPLGMGTFLLSPRFCVLLACVLRNVLPETLQHKSGCREPLQPEKNCFQLTANPK